MKVLFNPIQQNYNNQSKKPSFKALSKNELCGLERFFVEKYNFPIHLMKNRAEFAKSWHTYAQKIGLTKKAAAQVLKNEVFPAGMEKYSIPDLLNFAGLYCKQDSDGMYTLSNYYQPITSIDVCNLIPDETKLLKRVKEIEGVGEFETSNAKSLGSIKKIGGFVGLQFSKVKDLGKLEEIGSHLLMYESDIKDLGKLRKIGGDAYLNNTKLKSLGKLEEIGGNAILCNSDIKDLGDLKKIGGMADLRGTKIESLGQLKEIGGDALLYFNPRLKDLGELEKIGGGADFTGIRHLKSLNKLKEIGGNCALKWSKVEDLGELENIGKSVDVRNSSVINFDNLKNVGGDMFLNVHQLEKLRCVFVNGNLSYEPIKIPDFKLMKDKFLFSLGYLFWKRDLKEQMKEAKKFLI